MSTHDLGAHELRVYPLTGAIVISYNQDRRISVNLSKAEAAELVRILLLEGVA